MHNDLRHIDLTFPSIPVSDGEVRPSLRRLLYKGGACVPADKADKSIEEGLLGDVLPDRVDLVSKIHEVINGDVVGGGSARTARARISRVAAFFAWGDRSGAALNLSDVQRTYVDWSEHLLHRAAVARDVSKSTIYTYASKVGGVFG